MTLPGLSEADFQRIMESSEVGACVVLETEKFLSSFQLSDTGILEEIRAILLPNASFRTELYQMNIYTSPTNHFPCGDSTSGIRVACRLVVCLPSLSNGGSLVARHDGRQTTYDWSLPADDPVHKIHWAAFFGDVEHEIIPPTKGHYVTLTYNLYRIDQISLNVVSPFYSSLKAAHNNSHFLPDGGILGFGCQHAYILEEFNKEDTDTVLLLKGSDRTVFSAATSLNLDVSIKPIIKVEHAYDYQYSTDHNLEYVGKKFEVRTAQRCHHISGEFVDFESWLQYFEEEGYEESGGIAWCQPPKEWSPSIFAPFYVDGYPCCHVGHQAPAILVTIPKWAERLSSSEYSPAAKKLKTDA